MINFKIFESDEALRKWQESNNVIITSVRSVTISTQKQGQTETPTIGAFVVYTNKPHSIEPKRRYFKR